VSCIHELKSAVSRLFQRNGKDGGVQMSYYPNPEERANFAAGLRALAEFIESRPEIPAPWSADVMVFPPGGSDAERRAEIDAIASRIGTEGQFTHGGHYTALTALRAGRIPRRRHPARQRRERVTEMPAILVLAGVGVMAAVALVILAVLVIGIRRGDRRHLANAPRSVSDAFARRLLVGVRYPAQYPESPSSQENGKEVMR
jgi:hypothetical protein